MDAHAMAEQPQWQARRVWLALLLLAGLGVLLYTPVLKGLVLQWWQDPNYTHGFFVPPFAAYLFWRDRTRWEGALQKPSDAGLLVMLAGIGLLLLGTAGSELFLTRISLVVLLGGIVLYLAGFQFLRAVGFPLGYLVLMVPLPTVVFYQITFPLQLLASRFAAACLEIVGVPVLREGNLINLPNYTLEVVEACSGIRSLMSLVALAVAYAYLGEKRTWVRIALVAVVLPIAIVSNGLRIVGTGLATYAVGPKLADGFFHIFSGWLIFLTALLLLLLAHRLLRMAERPGKEDARA